MECVFNFTEIAQSAGQSNRMRRQREKSCVTPEVFPNENGNYFFITRRRRRRERNVRALDRLHYPMTARFNHRAHHTQLNFANDFSFTFNCLRMSLKSKSQETSQIVSFPMGFLMFQFRNGEFFLFLFHSICSAKYVKRTLFCATRQSL